MRKNFRGYYRPTEAELADLWQRCTFVLDANVLLNLYRYPQQARTDFLSVLQQVQDRLWVPHQAALEFQENRLRVIAEQVKRFDELRAVLKNIQNKLGSEIGNLQLAKRHSSINPDMLLTGVRDVFESFEKYLVELEAGQPDVHGEDKLLHELDRLLDGKVGDPPQSQSELDNLYQLAKERYTLKRPPGYKDVDSKKEDDIYIKNELVFRCRYGDFVLWSELIEATKGDSTLKYIILVTDDRTEDWWWIVDSRGKKTIGPRPELVDEIMSSGNVQSFYMYSSERFLEHAKDRLGAEVKQESIEQVRDIASAHMAQEGRLEQNWEEIAEQAVMRWLEGQYPGGSVILHSSHGFPDIVVEGDGGSSKTGYEVKFLSGAQTTYRKLKNVYNHTLGSMKRAGFSKLNLVFVINLDDFTEALEYFVKKLDLEDPRLSCYVGVLNFINSSDEEAPEFYIFVEP